MKKLTFIFSLILVVVPVILAGCTSTSRTVSTNLREFSFSDMWNKTVNATGVNDISTHIRSFTMHIGKNNSIEDIYFDFYGSDTSGRFKTYSVDVGYTGSLKTYHYDEDTISFFQQTISPGYFFDALDKANLDEMFGANRTTYIVADSQAGSVGYSNEYADLYLMEEGKLTPLKEVIFYSSMPWLTIGIYNMTDLGMGIGASVEQIWFLPQDLGKAANVEYVETSEPGFGIYLVDTGELIISLHSQSITHPQRIRS